MKKILLLSLSVLCVLFALYCLALNYFSPIAQSDWILSISWFKISIECGREASNVAYALTFIVPLVFPCLAAELLFLVWQKRIWAILMVPFFLCIMALGVIQLIRTAPNPSSEISVDRPTIYPLIIGLVFLLVSPAFFFFFAARIWDKKRPSIGFLRKTSSGCLIFLFGLTFLLGFLHWHPDSPSPTVLDLAFLTGLYPLCCLFAGSYLGLLLGNKPEEKKP